MSEKAREHEYIAGYPAHKDFLRSLVWADLSAELSVWLENIRDQLEASESHDETCQLRGCAQACRYMLGLPQSIVDQYEINKEENEDG